MEEDWDLGTQPLLDYYKSFLDPELQEIVEETSKEEEEDKNHIYGSGIDITNLDVLDKVLTIGAIWSLNPFSYPGDTKRVYLLSREYNIIL